MAPTATSQNLLTKKLGNLITVDTVSTKPEDFVDAINIVCSQLGGLTNAGIYADIKSVEQDYFIVGEVRNEFLDIKEGFGEKPGNYLAKDNSSTKIEDIDLINLADENTNTISQASDKEEAVKEDSYKKLRLGYRTRVLLSNVQTYNCPTSQTCDECRGNGRCVTCKGQGEVRCERCAGRGEKYCSLCGGSGRCDKCAGRGEVRCIFCNGSGSNSEGRCYHCGGSGFSSCTKCGGSGSCGYCEGSGRKTCGRCDGKGMVSCSNCKGSGFCSNCHGYGKVTCDRCQGSGNYQTFQTLETTRSAKKWQFASFSPLHDILPQATGESLFHGLYKEWRRTNILSYDKTEEAFRIIREGVAEKPELVDEFRNSMSAVSGLSSSDGEEYPYRQFMDVRKVHVTTINYTVDDIDYSFQIIGKNNVVTYKNVPKNVRAYKETMGNRLQNRMTYYARAKAYCYLSAYIFQCDGLDMKESHLLDIFVNDLHLSEKKKERFLKELKAYGPKMPYQKLRKKIKLLFSSKRTLSFAWQCMAIDKEISPEEEKLFNQLSKEFKATDKDIADVKCYAKRFNMLEDKDIVSEYLGRSPVSKGGGFISQLASWCYLHFKKILLAIAAAIILLFIDSKDGFSGGSFMWKFGYFVICPDQHHPHLIDLGLPSGTKWSCCNVGASTPKEYGGYYAWGETEVKSNYNWRTYIHCDGSKETCIYIGDDIAGTEYDVAHVKWDGSWRMPTIEQIKELLTYCTQKKLNGVKGTLVTGPNGNTIFLPAAGIRVGEGPAFEGKYGIYWSSSGSSENESYEYHFGYGSNDRAHGLTVRPVCP